jgi:hypothetical protein
MSMSVAASASSTAADVPSAMPSDGPPNTEQRLLVMRMAVTDQV